MGLIGGFRSLCFVVLVCSECQTLTDTGFAGQSEDVAQDYIFMSKVPFFVTVVDI